jgi:hypothetical protein
MAFELAPPEIIRSCQFSRTARHKERKYGTDIIVDSVAHNITRLLFVQTIHFRFLIRSLAILAVDCTSTIPVRSI